MFWLALDRLGTDKDRG